MSRKPTIKISYPEASEKALQLTEAMVKRAPGKRVVETESEAPIFPDGGELFSSFIRCKTQTGVELTLTLNSTSMDYALETLIKPNLTADEKKRILGEDTNRDNLFSPAQAAEAPGQALDGDSSADVPSAEREAATQSNEAELKKNKTSRKKKKAKRAPSWDDVMAEAQSLWKDKSDETEAEQDGEIEPGLLNDIDEDKSSTAEVGTLREPTEEKRHD